MANNNVVAIGHGQENFAIAIGMHAGRTGQWYNSYIMSQIKKLRYVVQFRKPVNVIDLYGRICSATKNRDLLVILHHLWIGFDSCITYADKETAGDDNMADRLIFASIGINGWYDNINQTKMYDIAGEFEELEKEIGAADKVAVCLERLNGRKIPLLDAVMDVVRAFAAEYIDESAVKNAMSPEAVAAALAAAAAVESESSEDGDSDDDMLDRLEAFAAKCDNDVSPIVSCGWIIE